MNLLGKAIYVTVTATHVGLLRMSKASLREQAKEATLSSVMHTVEIARDALNLEGTGSSWLVQWAREHWARVLVVYTTELSKRLYRQVAPETDTIGNDPFDPFRASKNHYN